MILKREDAIPEIPASACVAPSAVVRGDVRIGQRTVVLAGAVITAEGGRVEIGSDCVVMEQAVLRGTRRHPLRLGDRCLVGPHAHLTGCRVDDGAFLATGSCVFNGAEVGGGAEVRIHGVVHVNSRLPAAAVVPIGWVAVGDPAQILPPERHEEIWKIQEALDFPGTVFRSARDEEHGERTRRYAAALARQREDRIAGDGEEG